MQRVYKERRCKTCKEWFVPRSANTQYCYGKCARNAKRAKNNRYQRSAKGRATENSRRQRSRPVYNKKPCKKCGALFRPKASNSQYCSRTCAALAHGERNRAWNKNFRVKRPKDYAAQLKRQSDWRKEHPDLVRVAQQKETRNLRQMKRDLLLAAKLLREAGIDPQDHLLSIEKLERRNDLCR